jgi:hypothetical protein
MDTPELARIADIIPPAPAPADTTTLFYLAVAILVMIAYGIYRYIHSSTSQLQRLRRLHQRGTVDNRELAFRLNHLIRQQLHLSRLSPNHPPADVAREDWQAFIAALQSACFSHNSLDSDSFDRVLDQANNWIRKSS